MTTSYWCIIIAGILPYIFIFIAKSKPDFLANNNAPRLYLQKLTGFRQRAHWASQNSFEAFPFFAAAILTANLTGNISISLLNNLAIAFILARVIYGLCYLLDLATLRSIFWFIGIGCVIAIFIASL